MEICFARITNCTEDAVKKTSEVRDAYHASVSVAESVYDSSMRAAHIVFEYACDTAIEAAAKEKALSEYTLAKSEASDTHFLAMADASAKGFWGISAIAESNARHSDAMLSHVSIGVSRND